MARLFANDATSTLTSGVDDVTNPANIQLEFGDGALFPDPSGDDFFVITIENPAGQYEICHCDTRVGDTLTISRGEEGTTPLMLNIGDRVELRTTKGTLDDFIQATAGVIDGGTF